MSVKAQNLNLFKNGCSRLPDIYLILYTSGDCSNPPKRFCPCPNASMFDLGDIVCLKVLMMPFTSSASLWFLGTKVYMKPKFLNDGPLKRNSVLGLITTPLFLAKN